MAGRRNSAGNTITAYKLIIGAILISTLLIQVSSASQQADSPWVCYWTECQSILHQPKLKCREGFHVQERKSCGGNGWLTGITRHKKFCCAPMPRSSNYIEGNEIIDGLMTGQFRR